MMTSQEIIKTVQNLPLSEQEKVLRVLENTLRQKVKSTPVSEDEVEKVLLAKGIISEIPERLIDDEEESYKPVRVSGKPLSEMILEERE